MTDLQIIESLCSVIEQQAALIRELVTQLRQIDAVTSNVSDEVCRINAAYDEAIGDSAQ